MKWGLIGKSLQHSFSPEYFKKKFELLGLADSYDLLELADLLSVKESITALGWSGFNVTIPYKEDIIPYLDKITDTARAIGAVNCVKIENGKWIGTNTDAEGFEKSILPFLENHYPRALILGTGGASKAVEYVLKNRGIDVWYLTRNKEKNNHLAYQDIQKESLAHFPLIINTTPLGTAPHTEQYPDIPYDGIGSQHLLVDLIYNPPITQFLQKGKDQNAKTQNGLRMLEIQAELSWKFWNSENAM